MTGDDPDRSISPPSASADRELDAGTSTGTGTAGGRDEWRRRIGASLFVVGIASTIVLPVVHWALPSDIAMLASIGWAVAAYGVVLVASAGGGA